MNKNTAQLLEQHFDTAFAAPDGIARLRELILTLAMQGKLVEQVPNDPPASDLLKEIEAEKQRLVKAGKIKKPKPLPPIKPEEVPYALSQGWEWVRLGNFLQMINGRAFKPSDWIAEGLPIVRIQNLNNHQASFNYCDESDVKEQHVIENGEFLISWSGTPGTSFGAFIWKRGKAALNQHIFKCFQIGNPYTDNFLRLAINSRLGFLISQAQGAVGLKHVTKGTLENMLLPLPPLPEQHRIVARIDQLMARCDDLEKLRKEREEKRLAFHAAAIKQLLDAPDGSAWDFIEQHFGELYTVKENVAELRKAILQLAVMGRLVPQDPNDPPASELLKEIEAEKQRLVQAGKMKQPKPLPPIKPEEAPYELPHGWEWVRLGEVGITQTGTTPPSKDRENYGDYIPFVGPGDIKNGCIDYSGEGLSEQGLSKGRLIDANSVLMVCIGGSIGKHAINERDTTCNQQINTLTPYSPIPVKYIYGVMAAVYFQNAVLSQSGGSATPIINKQKWSGIPAPIPPLPEQHRIVARIDQLMALCDTLDQQIAAATGKQTELLNAVMAAI